jgi:hypothetical protein
VLKASVGRTTKGRNLITSYGLFWKLDETEWLPADGHKVKRRLLGRLGSKGSRLRGADFWSQSGIYVLYGNYGLYYIGVSGSGLGQRIHDHLTDIHSDQWDRFSWFGFRELNGDRDAKGLGLLGEVVKTSSIRLSKARGDIEAILFRAFAGPGNQKHPNFGAKLQPWEQVKLTEVPKFLERLNAVSS